MHIIATCKLRDVGLSLDMINNIIKRVRFEENQKQKQILRSYKSALSMVSRNTYFETYLSHIGPRYICPNCLDPSDIFYNTQLNEYKNCSDCHTVILPCCRRKYKEDPFQFCCCGS